MKLKTILSISFLLAFLNSCEKDPANTKNSESVGSFGTASYTFDNSSAKTVELSNSTQSISITDKKGIKWTLTVPQQTTFSKVQIKMTALNEVTQSSSDCNINSGIIFEPHGLIFDTPATLSVEFPAGKTTPSLFFSISGKGQNDTLMLEPAELQGKIYKMNIFHFSGMMSGDPLDPESLGESFSGDYDKAKAEAQAIANQPLNVPVPPDITPDYCADGISQDGVAQGYVEQLSNPERKAITKLLSIGKSMALLGHEGVDPVADALPLSERLITKAKQIINQYGSDENKFYCVMVAALQIARENSLLGGDHTEEITSLLATKIGALEENLLDKLKNEHDYTLIKYLVNVERFRALLGGTGDFLDRLSNATNFEINITNETMGSGGDVAGRIIVIFKIKSNVKFTESFEVMTGEGELSFTSGKVLTAHDECADPWIHMVPFTTSITTDLKFDPCDENMVKLMYGPIYPMCGLMETSNVIGEDCARLMAPTAFSGTVIANQIGFDIYDMMLDRIFIERGLENKNPLVIDESFQKSNAAFTVTYTVKVEHKPQ